MNGKYKIILADCPWDYETKNSPAYGGAVYKTMTVEELNTLPIHLISDKDCVLFCWATFPKLKEALEVITSWGFRYRTGAFVWIKLNRKAGTPRVGLGYWTKQNAECCLLATKGNPKCIARNIRQIVEAPITIHSAKPPEVRDRIVQLIGDVPRIELFARERVTGWDSLGNEVDGLDIRQSLHIINVCQLIRISNQISE